MHWRKGMAWLLLAVPAIGSDVRRGGFTSAEVCGRCHRDILAAWKSSLHSKSIEDRLFQDSLEETKSRFGEGVGKRCLGCHAPVMAYSGDRAFQDKVTWEGVTCDFCHSIVQVDMQNAARPYRLHVGFTKFGPLKDTSSRAHGVSFSNLHTNPIVCAGCHDSRNENGLMVLSSYSEWQESSFAADRSSCLNCHMPRVKGRTVDAKVRHSEGAVNLHEMPGGHSVDQLNKALLARLTAQREDGQLHVKLFLRNRGAGHMVPTGSPLRKLVVAVQVSTAGGPDLTVERAYQRVIVDKDGNTLADEPGIWVRGARVASDNRLKPNEERVENFSFPVPPAQGARIQARFWYHYSPMDKPDTGKSSFLTLPAIVGP